MKKANNTTTVAVSLLHFAALLCFIIFAMEARVPIHFGFSGEADDWGSKWIYLLFGAVPVILAVAYAVYDKRSSFKGKEHNRSMERTSVNCLAYIFMAVSWCVTILAQQMTNKIDTQLVCTFVSVLLGFVLIALSNFFGKVEQNKYFGIRLLWTLKDPIVWNKTHRFAGHLGVTTGALLLVWSIVQVLAEPVSPYVSLLITLGAVLFAMLIAPSVYAYRLYHKLHS